MLDEGDGCEGLAERLGHHDQVAHGGATTTLLGGQGHRGDLHLDELGPELWRVAQRLCGPDQLGRALLLEEGAEDLGDRLLVAAEREVDCHCGSSKPARGTMATARCGA